MNEFFERVFYVLDSFFSWIHQAFVFVGQGVHILRDSFGYMVDAVNLLPSFAIGACFVILAVAVIYLVLGR